MFQKKQKNLAYDEMGGAQVVKPKKKRRLIWVLGIVVGIIIVAAVGSGSGGTGTQKNIDLVKNGYLGDYTAVTVGEVLSVLTQGEGKWVEGTAEDGTKVVEHQLLIDREEAGDFFTEEELSEAEIRIQFEVQKDGSFSVGGVQVPGIDTTYQSEVAKLFNQIYYGYYIEKKAEDYQMLDENLDLNQKAVDAFFTLFPDTPADRVLYGAGSEYTGDRNALFAACTETETAREQAKAQFEEFFLWDE